MVLLIAAFVSSVGVFLVVPYLGLYLRDTAGLSSATVGLLLGLNYWGTRVSGLAAGALVHRWGMRPVMLLGNLLRVAGYLLLLGDSLAQVTCAVLLIGIGAGVFFPVAKACLLRVVDEEHQLKAIAARNMCANTGVALGPCRGRRGCSCSPPGPSAPSTSCCCDCARPGARTATSPPRRTGATPRPWPSGGPSSS